MADITYSEYYTEVEHIAEECIKQAKEEDRLEEIYDVIHEYCDGHQWIIYCHSNFDVLKHSDNDSYGQEEGLVSQGEDFRGYIMRMAFWALSTDVYERAQRMLAESEEEVEA